MHIKTSNQRQTKQYKQSKTMNHIQADKYRHLNTSTQIQATNLIAGMWLLVCDCLYFIDCGWLYVVSCK